MEHVSLTVLLLFTAALCALAFLAGRLSSKKHKNHLELEKALEQSKKDLKDYRSQVTSHFQETAHQVKTLTKTYRNVYEHLARGSQELCGANNVPGLMDDLNPLAVETMESPKKHAEDDLPQTDNDIDQDLEAKLETPDTNVAEAEGSSERDEDHPGTEQIASDKEDKEKVG